MTAGNGTGGRDRGRADARTVNGHTVNDRTVSDRRADGHTVDGARRGGGAPDRGTPLERPGRTTEDLTHRHVEALVTALRDPEADLGRVARWGARLAAELDAGGRLLVAGNGGSAAEAQHLSSELVGRYRWDRRPFSALALHADGSSVTAIGNDYGADEVFARQVEAHGRAGDTVLLLSTSGTSPNVLNAARRARALGLRVWALTGRSPNPLAAMADDALCVAADDTATVQEVHLLAAHVLCEALDEALGVSGAPPRTHRNTSREVVA